MTLCALIRLLTSCLGLSRINLLQQSSSSADIEPIRLVDVADSHNVLRRIDARATLTEKHVVLDLSSIAAMRTILAQVRQIHYVCLCPACYYLVSVYQQGRKHQKKAWPRGDLSAFPTRSGVCLGTGYVPLHKIFPFYKVCFGIFTVAYIWISSYQGPSLYLYTVLDLRLYHLVRIVIRHTSGNISDCDCLSVTRDVYSFVF